MCFSATASSENDQGSMNLASKAVLMSLTEPSRVAAKKPRKLRQVDLIASQVGGRCDPSHRRHCWHRPRRRDPLPDCCVHRRVFVDLDRPRGTGPHSVRTRAAEPGFPHSP
jgi:hypothetical protein